MGIVSVRQSPPPASPFLQEKPSMSHRELSRRQFCQLAGTGLGALCLPSLSFAEDDVTKKNAYTDEFGKAPEFVPGSFTLAVLPDTQHYCQKWNQHYYNQTQWIADNADRYNIKHVLHLGDITNRNTRDQWKVARKAMSTLDGKVPYAMVPGNHDYGLDGKSNNRDTFLNEFFSFDEYSQQKTFGGAYEEGRLESNYHTFRGGDQDYLILGLEWGPRDQVVEWANKIAEKHPNHCKILITHAYMYFDETRYDYKKYGKKQTWNPHVYKTAKLDGGTNDGEDLWNKLVSKHPNFVMTYNGHVLNDGLGRMTSKGAGGRGVHQMLVNYQMKHEGGEGFMRLVEFQPDGKTVQVKAYSPSLNEHKVDSQNQFVLQLDA
jgi:predicted phosphodiesterase